MVQKCFFIPLFIGERERELRSWKKFTQNEFIYYSCKLIRVSSKLPSHEMSNVSKPMPLEQTQPALSGSLDKQKYFKEINQNASFDYSKKGFQKFFLQ